MIRFWVFRDAIEDAKEKAMQSLIGEHETKREGHNLGLSFMWFSHIDLFVFILY